MCNPNSTTADEVNIEVGDESTSSDYESSHSGSSTDSLASSLNKYLEENGRRYHSYYGPDKNFMPADDPEKDRLDIHHECFRLIAGEEIYKAPVKNPQRVLDLGTGTGIWCLDFADENPQAEVVGVDLSPIQPAWVPPNCKFETDDLELDWTYPHDTYDFIHSRNVLPSIADVSKYIRQIYKRLKPGGFVELAEFDANLYSDDNSIPADWPPMRSIALTVQAVEAIGREFFNGEKMSKLLEEAGFVDIVVTPLKLPNSPWAKNKALRSAGHLQALGLETGYHAYGMALFTRVLGMSEEEATKICDEARDAGIYRAKKEKVHDYSYFYIVYAKKPEDA